ncbi:uncharacterized protein LOC115755693 isoform X2 [Rhodamnia argentea]|uniref:Uncharacterized protein LOC115755693 isoform X2 n=1 Tax=Rhodamnia argentea TaxID=178133 RepID=A0ABM3HSP0_9MYRT|nr:uncharacterized protein LOC115755693 isoform X2 [Rhodamnia argentea]
MFPSFNPLSKSHLGNRVQSNGAVPQQVVSPNPFASNPCNVLPHPMQLQSQMGILPHSLIPSYGLMNYMNNGQAVNMTLPGLAASSIMNGPNPLLPSQNNQIAMQQFGQFQNMAPNVNQMHLSQPPGHMLVQNLPQQLNQNLGLQNLLLCLPNAMANVNQLSFAQQLNPSQRPSFNGFLGSNQGAQALCPQNRFSLANTQGGCDQQLNQNQQNGSTPVMGPSVLRSLPTASQQQPQSHLMPDNVHPNHSERSPNLPGPVCRGKQENTNYRGGINTSNPNFRNSPRKDFGRRTGRMASQRGSHRPHFHDMKDGKRKFEFANGHRGKEISNQMAGNFGQFHEANPPKEQKRAPSITYTEQEIQQWCEERRRNYPSKANMEKKLTDSKKKELDVKIRQEQLKKILAQQAELGVEIAEIPSHYLSDIQKKDELPEESSRRWTKKERFHKNRNKRGHHNRRDQFNKKQRLEATSSTDPPSLNKNRTTLLQKLLSKDIKRDNTRLFQVFRFMVTNSFFKYWPEQSLKFPKVVANENVCESDMIEDKSQILPTEGSEDRWDCHAGNSDGGGDESSDDENEDVRHSRVEKSFHGKRDGLPEEEEGEIID